MDELFEISFKHAVSSPTDIPEYLVVAESAEEAIEKLREYLKEKYRLKLIKPEFVDESSKPFMIQHTEAEFQRIDALQLHRLICKGSVIC